MRRTSSSGTICTPATPDANGYSRRAPKFCLPPERSKAPIAVNLVNVHAAAGKIEVRRQGKCARGAHIFPADELLFSRRPRGRLRGLPQLVLLSVRVAGKISGHAGYNRSRPA